MNEAQTAAVISIFMSSVYLLAGVIVLGNCIKLREALSGKIGYRLMFVITRVAWVLMATLVISVIRQVVSFFIPTEWRILITLSPILVNAMIIITMLWVMVAVRSWREMDQPDPTHFHVSHEPTSEG